MSIDAGISWVMNSQLFLLAGNCAVCVGGFFTACKVTRWKLNYIIKSFYPIIVQILLLLQFIFSDSAWASNLKIGIILAMTLGVLHELITLLAQCIYAIKTHIEQKVIKKMTARQQEGAAQGISNNPLDQFEQDQSHNRPLKSNPTTEMLNPPKRYSRRRPQQPIGENTETTFLPVQPERASPDKKVKIRGTNGRKVSQMQIQYDEEENTNQ